MTGPSGFSPHRGLSTLEFLFGAAIVLGHNVWRIVPNEVVILTAAAVISMRLRAGRWDFSTLGFRRPRSWGYIL
jgi:hypothetical protein